MKTWFKRKAYHFVFIISLTALTLLVAWWSVFLNKTIRESYQMQYDSMIQGLKHFALSMGHRQDQPPVPGKLEGDPRMEIVPVERASRDHRVLVPFWPDFAVQPTGDHLREMEDKLSRRRLMVFGESGLLVLVILVSGFMIYRMYWLERRTTQELHELWSRVSHEIKTPITGLKAFLQTLQEQELSREEVKPLLVMALKQVERQQQLAENMLVGQKLRKSGMGIQLKPINLAEFLKTYFQYHSIHLSLSGVELSLPQDGPVVVAGDVDALRIIVDNVTDNAVKYGGSNLKFRIDVKRGGKNGYVVFTDNGVGFDPAMKESMFRAFQRLEGELPVGPHGTGMGLHISRQLARTMNGDLEARSAGKGRGASFTLSLKIKNGKNQPGSTVS